MESFSRITALCALALAFSVGKVVAFEPSEFPDGLAERPSSIAERDAQFAQVLGDFQEKRSVVEKVHGLLPLEARATIPDLTVAAQIVQQAVASESDQTIEMVQKAIDETIVSAGQLINCCRNRAESDPSQFGDLLLLEFAAWQTLGDAHQAAGRPWEAIKVYREALLLFGRDWEPETWAKGLIKLGSSLQYVSSFDEATDLYEDALRWATSSAALGAEHAVILQLLDRLAASDWKRGYFARAISACRRALNLRERQLGEEDLETIKTVNQLAVVLRESGDIPRAEALFRRALTVREKVCGEGHEETLETVTDLAQLLLTKGNLAEAESLWRRALAFREQTLGRVHLDTLSCLNNLGNLLSTRGDIAGAEPLMRRAVAGRESILGSNHPDTLASLGNLACLLADKGDFAGAEPLFRRVLTAQEHNLGPDDADTLATAGNLAIVLEAKGEGDFPEAEALYRRVLAARTLVLGKEHPEVARSCYNLSLFLLKKNARKEALVLAKQAVATAGVRLPKEEPNRVLYEKHLAALDKSAAIRNRNAPTPVAPQTFRNTVGGLRN